MWKFATGTSAMQGAILVESKDVGDWDRRMRSLGWTTQFNCVKEGKDKWTRWERGRDDEKEEAVDINVKGDSKITGERQQVKIEEMWISESTTP